MPFTCKPNWKRWQAEAIRADDPQAREAFTRGFVEAGGKLDRIDEFFTIAAKRTERPPEEVKHTVLPFKDKAAGEQEETEEDSPF